MSTQTNPNQETQTTSNSDKKPSFFSSAYHSFDARQIRRETRHDNRQTSQKFAAKKSITNTFSKQVTGFCANIDNLVELDNKDCKSIKRTHEQATKYIRRREKQLTPRKLMEPKVASLWYMIPGVLLLLLFVCVDTWLLYAVVEDVAPFDRRMTWLFAGFAAVLIDGLPLFATALSENRKWDTLNKRVEKAEETGEEADRSPIPRHTMSLVFIGVVVVLLVFSIGIRTQISVNTALYDPSGSWVDILFGAFLSTVAVATSFFASAVAKGMFDRAKNLEAFYDGKMALQEEYELAKNAKDDTHNQLMNSAQRCSNNINELTRICNTLGTNARAILPTFTPQALLGTTEERDENENTTGDSANSDES